MAPSKKRKLLPKTATKVTPPSSFRFLDLPLSARRRVYHFLGFPTETEVSQRPRYKIDLTRDRKLSVPWNYDPEHREKKMNPTVNTNIFLVNKYLCNELYEILYSNTLFIIHLPSTYNPRMRTLSGRARCYITHAMISYVAIPETLTFFDTTSYPLALDSAVNAVTPFLPNLSYFGITFWSPHFPRLFPAPSTTEKLKADEQMKNEDVTPNFTDMLFLSRTLSTLTQTHPKIEKFALLCNMQPKGELNWKRDGGSVRKSLVRDLRRCMAKVVGNT